MYLTKRLFKGDRYIWGIYITLILISCIVSYSASSVLAFRNTHYYAPIISHVKHLFYGFIVMILASQIATRYYQLLGGIALVLSPLLLFFVQMTPEVNGANRNMWGFQPSEIAKFACVFACAYFLNSGMIKGQIGIHKNPLRMAIFLPLFLAGFVALDNLSTGILIMAVIYTMVFVGGMRLKSFFKYIVGINLLFVVMSVAALFSLPSDYMPSRATTWKSRIEKIFQDEEPLVHQKLTDSNQQVIYGHMAVARGGVIGNGLDSQLCDFLPLAFSDFVFSIIIEMFGMVLGGGFMIFLYLALLVRGLIIFRQCNNPFLGFMMLGLILLIVYQSLINMAVGVGLGPVTGQPLPLVSRGGTSILVISGFFGLIQGICNRTNGSDSQSDDDLGWEYLEEIDEEEDETGLVQTETSVVKKIAVEEPVIVPVEKENPIESEENNTIYPY